MSATQYNDFTPTQNTQYKPRTTQSAELKALHSDRMLMAQFAALLAQEAGYKVWISYDRSETDKPRWPSITIKLPNGQVSFLVPKERLLIADVLKEDLEPWERHDSQERFQRIQEFLMYSFDEDDNPLLPGGHAVGTEDDEPEGLGISDNGIPMYTYGGPDVPQITLFDKHDPNLLKN